MSKTPTANTTNTRADVYARVTDRIIEDLEKGVRPWLKPWSADNATERLPSLPLRHNGTPYRGINVLLLCDEGFPLHGVQMSPAPRVTFRRNQATSFSA